MMKLQVSSCRIILAVAAACFTLPFQHASADIRRPDSTNSNSSNRASSDSSQHRSGGGIRTPSPSYSAPRSYSSGASSPRPYSFGTSSPRSYGNGAGYSGERIRRFNDVGALPTNPGTLPTNQGNLPRPGGSYYNNSNYGQYGSQQHNNVPGNGNPQISVHSYNNNNGYNNNHNNYDYHSYGDGDRRHHEHNDSTVIIDPYLGYYPYGYGYGNPYGYSYPYGYYPPQPDVVYVPQQPEVVYVPEQPQVVYAPDSNHAPIDSAPIGQEGPDGSASPQGDIPAAAAQAITDIQEAWTIADEGLLRRHIDDAHPISVYKDGKFDHTASAADYLLAAKQSFDAVLTQSFVLNHRTLLADGSVKAFGRHIYYDGDNHRQMVFVCYWLQPVGNRWIITTANAASDADHLMMDPAAPAPSSGN